ncbi:MAG TPA: class I SAM-dependent methyltransferase [Melioribacteraceae bacterium]|nr:class I SAM-dependent methyltransferase [Melioribacteraceae bacterium]
MSKLCPVCGNTNYKKIGLPKANNISKNFLDKEYYVVQCLNCEAYFVSPEINFSEEQWAKLYNSEYFVRQSDWLERRRKKELANRFNHFENLINKKNISFLDVGTGEGKAIIEAKKRKWKITAIDIVDNRNSDAKNTNINFIKGNFIDIDLTPKSFDFIYLDSVIEHVLNPLEYLKKAAELLTDDGVVYIGVPNEDSLFNDVRKLIFCLTKQQHISEKIKPFYSPYHIIGYNFNSLKTIINNSGLEIKTLRNFGRKFEFLGNKPFSKDFWISFLFLFPIEFIGLLIKRDVYLEAYVKKQKK